MAIDMTHQPPPQRRVAVARAGLASLKRVALAGGAVSERALSFMNALRDHLMRVNVDIPSLAPIDEKALAAAVPEAEWRERILRGMTLIALLDGEPTPARVRILEETAAALGIDAAPVRAFRNLAEERIRLVQIDIARRGFVRQAAGAYLREEGPRAILDIVRGALGKTDARLAARYHTLDTYPAETFGRAYADFIVRNGFSYPGEMGGPPPPVMRHDCCHVLGGYGTTPAEECAVVSFQAGFEKADPFFVILFAIAQFEIGIGASPFLPGLKGAADPPRMFIALEHGTHVNTDLIGDPAFDPWAEFESPILVVRKKFAIPPRGREPEYPDDLPY
jgi:hypothetical protein